jgi:hypothetical protein
MNQYIKCLVFFVALTSMVSCSSDIYQANWQSHPVIADGIPSEWSLPLRFYDSKSGLQYNITNDESAIYFCMRATEPREQMNIMNSGMIIKLDPSGNKKATAEIHLPLPVRKEMNTHHENIEKEAEFKQDKNHERMNISKHFAELDHEIKLSGFRSGYDGTFRISKLNGINASLNWDDKNIMTYELVIPLKSLYAIDFESLKDNPVINFDISVAANSRGQQSSPEHGGYQGGGGHSGGHHQGGMGGGMSGGIEGGSGGGRGGGMHSESQQHENMGSGTANEPTSIKFKIKLNGLVKK